jgi:hypothetical protein
MEFSSSAEDGARALFRSAQRLKTLPDYPTILPGAFARDIPPPPPAAAAMRAANLGKTL